MGTDKTSLGDRMKAYENAHRIKLTPRMPVILRLDGVAFHTLTKGFVRPLDRRFVTAMNTTAISLCENVQGACYAYVQSDEISILLVDYKNRDSQAWFGKNLQKMVSVSASIASTTFTRSLENMTNKPCRRGWFDSRVIQLPDHEVENYFIWRQNDCSRNSILSLGQAHFSHKQLHGKKTPEIIRMLKEDLDVPVVWEDCPLEQKFGCVVEKVAGPPVKMQNKKTKQWEDVRRSMWVSTGSHELTSIEGTKQRLRLREMAFQEEEDTSRTFV